MADDLAQQILSPVQADNSVKALAWDAFNQAKDPNDLAMRLKVLGLPNSVKADLWDAKSGNYNPAPNAGLAGVAQPNVQMPSGNQPGFMQRTSEQALGISHPLAQAQSEIQQLISNPTDTLKRTVTQPVIGARDLAYNLMTNPKETLLALSGGRDFASDVQSGNVSGAAGNLVGNAIKTAAMASGNPEARATMAVPVNTGRNAVASGLTTAAEPAGNLAGLLTALHELKAGNPVNAILSAAFGKPAVASSLRGLASVIRPGAPSVAVPAEFESAAANRFLNAPGINGEISPAQQLALPPAPIELGPSSAVAANPTEGVLPAARRVVTNTNTGKPVNQYLTSVADPNQALSTVDTAGMRDTNTLAQNYFIQKMRQGLEEPPGTSMADQEAVMNRMAETAKTPWDVMQMRTQLGKPEAVQGIPGIFDYPIIKNGQRVGHARISISGDEARVGWFGPDERATGAPLDMGSADVRSLKTQFEADNPGVKLKWTPGSATAERAAARVARRSGDIPVPSIGPFSAPVEVNNQSNLGDLLTRSIQQARARK